MADEKRKDPKSDVGLLRRLSRITSGFIYGTDEEFREQNDSDMQDVRSTLNKISRTYKQTVGDNIVEFFNRVQSEEEKTKRDKIKGQQVKKKFVNVNDMVENPQNNLINDILFVESNRITLYQNYQMIFDHIPQMAQALHTIADNILSPDDFTKTIFNLFYDGVSVRNDDFDTNEDNEVINNLKLINKSYNMEERSIRIIRDTLKFGDQFVATLPIQEEMSKMLISETADKHRSANLFRYTTSERTITESHILSEANMSLDDKDISALNEHFGFSGEAAKDSSYWKNEVIRMVNENVEISDDYSGIIQESLDARRDFVKGYAGVDLPGSKPEDSPEEKENDIDDKSFRLNGCIVKVLDPSRVIKLSTDGTCYGYYYVEKVADSNFGQVPSRDRNGVATTSGINAQPQDQVNKDLKTDFITNIFVKNISKKINKKFIMKNKDFKYLIHNMLKQGFITDRKIKITYLDPSQVEHFMINEEDDEYGNSIYRPIMFTAKIYLAVLTTTLMQKLARSPDKRVFYIEVGLDEDTEGAVQSFVKDIKTKEVKMDNLKDINTVLNTVGTFHDLYIPVVNGEKPVEIDTQPGMDTNLDNDFLEYLRKAMMSGIGVPSTLLNYGEEVEFMRSLAMQNGQFVRKIITFQKRIGMHFSNLYRKIYKYEYRYTGESDTGKVNEAADPEDDIQKESKGKKKGLDVDLNKIEVKFPSPSYLNMSNMQDQINNAKDIIDYIVTTELGEEPDMAKKKYAVRAVTKAILPSIDWNQYEELIQNSIMEYAKDKLKTGDASNGGDDGGDDGGGGGAFGGGGGSFGGSDTSATSGAIGGDDTTGAGGGFTP